MRTLAYHCALGRFVIIGFDSCHLIANGSLLTTSWSLYWVSQSYLAMVDHLTSRYFIHFSEYQNKWNVWCEDGMFMIQHILVLFEFGFVETPDLMLWVILCIRTKTDKYWYVLWYFMLSLLINGDTWVWVVVCECECVISKQWHYQPKYGRRYRPLTSVCP